LATVRAGASDEERFGDVLSEPLRNGHSAKASPDGKVPIFTLSAVTSGDFSARNVKWTSADAQRVGNLWVEPGDLLIERSNTRELVGTTRLYRGASGVAIFPDLVIRARVGGRVQPDYAEIVLQAPSSRRYFQGRAQGISGSMPKIDQSVIANLVIPVPPAEVQANVIGEVARKLSLIDATSGALEAADRRADVLRSAVLGAAFAGALVPQDAGDEPASALLERVSGERQSSTRGRADAGRTHALRSTA
jgi:type I restriction enzyme S subunit